MAATKLSDLLREDLITLHLKAETSVGAIQETISPLRNDKRVDDFEKFQSEVLHRETVESTCLGCGVALPHARIDVVNDMVLAVGVSPKGVFFENGNQTVHLILVVGTPKRLATEYLRMVGTIARLLKDADFRQALMACTTPQEFISKIRLKETTG
jgi:mannitol/fructose-specific phosphotransferase system IIA component (Ntr-type)